jgi:hypothetical protein
LPQSNEPFETEIFGRKEPANGERMGSFIAQFKEEAS